MAERTTVGNLRDMARRIIAEGEAQGVKASNEAWELYGQPDVQYADLRSKATSVISQESGRKRWERQAS